MKKFLAGSAIASIYTTSGELIAISNTQINDTINLSVESQEVRSGYGNALDYIYYHSTRLEGQLEDAQFNLDYIKHNLGAQESHVASVYKSVSKTLTSGVNTFSDVSTSDIQGDYVWVYYNDKPYTFQIDRSSTSLSFENEYSALNNKLVCIKYLSQSESSLNIRNLTISSNFIPDVVKIVLEAQLFSSESGAADSSRIGTVTFTIPKAQLSGTQEISLSASGVASTPLSYLALKADIVGDNACASAAGVYGYITEILETASNWYEGVKYLAIATPDEDAFSVKVGEFIDVYAISPEDSFVVRPRGRVTYGTKTGGNEIVWANPNVEGGGNTKISADGKVLAGMLANDKLYVAVGTWSSVTVEEVTTWTFTRDTSVGEDVATIIGVTA